MDGLSETNQPADTFPQSSLSKPQRRVLGVLIEKSFTTPEGYPLTLKSATTACNQKSNRSPITNYSEDQVEQVLDELRELKTVAVVNTAGGRTERYRHLIRHVIRVSEPQLAILGELLLRGSQQMGELRSRASRMVTIADQEQLRNELADMLERGLVRASGPLGRRGIDVDHNLYESHEPVSFAAASVSAEAPHRTYQEPAAATVPSTPVNIATSDSESPVDQRGLETEVDRLKERVSELEAQIDEIRRELGI